MATVEFSLAHLSGNHFPIHFKRLIGPKIRLVKFTYFKVYTERFLPCLSLYSFFVCQVIFVETDQGVQ